MELETEPNATKEDSNPKLSLNAMNSYAVSGTLRFTRNIKGYPIKVLLDGGSGNNFIQPKFATFLQLDIQPTTPFKVWVGDGNSL